MPFLILLGLAGALVYAVRSSKSGDRPGGAAASGMAVGATPRPMASIVTNPALVQSAQHLVNQLGPTMATVFLANPEDGNANDARFRWTLSAIQSFLNTTMQTPDAVPHYFAAIHQAGIPMPLRADGVLDDGTNRALSIAAAL